MKVVGNLHGGERLQPGLLVLRSLHQVLDRLVQDLEALAVREDRGQRFDLGVVGATRWRVRRLAHAHRELLRRPVGEQGGAGRGVEHEALGLGQVRQRQEDVAVRDEEVLEVHARCAAGGVDHRNARAAVVREHDHRLETQHLGHVVLEHFDVAREAVAPAERLVGEAEAREVHRADAIAVAQSFCDLEPIDAARRKAMDQYERRRIGITPLDVEDLYLRRVATARAPREEVALFAPRLCTVHGGPPEVSCG